MIQLWGYVLSILGFIVMWLAGNGKWQGWALGIAGQGLWLGFAIAVHQPGLIIGCFVYGTVYARNLLKWRRERA